MLLLVLLLLLLMLFVDAAGVAAADGLTLVLAHASA